MAEKSSPLSMNSPHPSRSNDNLKEVSFYDRDADIHDPILSTQSMYVAIQLAHESASISGDLLNLFHSNLVKATIPQTYNFLEMVQWCTEHYLPNKRVVVVADGKNVICSISPQSIAATLLLTDQGDL